MKPAKCNHPPKSLRVIIPNDGYPIPSVACMDCQTVLCGSAEDHKRWLDEQTAKPK